MQEKNNLIKCKICGRTFEKTSNNQKYCSRDCYKESNRRNSRKKYQKREAKYELNCPICHDFFLPKSYSEKYCSDDCKHEARRLNGRRHYLIKVLDADYHFDEYTVRFDRDNESTVILKDGEFVPANPDDWFDARGNLIADYVVTHEEPWESIRKSKEFHRLVAHIFKMKFELLPELKDIEKILRL